MNQFAKHTIKNGLGGTNGSHKDAPVSFIEPHEHLEAQKVVAEAFKHASGGRDFEFRPAGYMVCVKIYIRPEEIKTIDTPEGKKTLYLPEVSRAEDKFTSSMGLVMALGPQAYKGQRADGTQLYPVPYAAVGDLVLFPRGECYYVTYRGVALALIPDDRVLATITDFTDVATGSPEYKI